VDNNAAATHLAAGDLDVTTMTVDLWDMTMSVNLRGPMLVCKHVIPALLLRGGGSIVIISSGLALAGDLGNVAYACSKSGLLALTRHVATTFGPQGVRCNAICPGPIETPLLRVLWTSEEARNLRLNRIPMGRFGEINDIIYMALYLASDESSWTTGAWLVVDGGISSNYF